MPFVKNQDIRIFYEVIGQGQPLVLLHGFAGNSKDWKRNGYVKKLSDDYQLILIDERGHGLSDKPHDPAAYETKKRASDIVAVLEDLNLKKSHVWGYSMGGEVCFGLGKAAFQILIDTRFPKHVQSIALDLWQPTQRVKIFGRRWVLMNILFR